MAHSVRRGLAGLSLGVCLGIAACSLASAAPAPVDELLRPAGVDQVTLSPSGSRVAALIKGRDSDSDLLVLERRGDRTVTLLTTHLGPGQAIASYRWLSDDFIAVYYASPDEDFAQFAIADISTRSLDVQDKFTRIIKSPWGDADHVLLSETGVVNCRSHTVARCLVSYDLPGRSSGSVSGPFTLLPPQFLAVSTSEVYATGRDRSGQTREFSLNTGTGQWQTVPQGTVAQRRAQLQQAQPDSDDVVQQRSRAGMPDATAVWTEPDHHLVGLIGHAPQRAFLALDSRLDGLQALLEQQYPDARVKITGLNQALTRGMVQIWGPDRPPRYVFFNDSGGLTDYAQLEPDLSASALGHTHIERGWAQGMPVAVTLPPQGMTPVGVLVEPLIATPQDAEEPLDHYDGIREAFAQAGITVVRALVPLPRSFPSTAAGGEWRQNEATLFGQVLSHVRADLAGGKPVCLYGRGPAGVLALTWSALAPMDCAVSVGARLDPSAYERATVLMEPQARQRVRRQGHTLFASPAIGTVTMTPSGELLHRELPALYGQPGSDQVADPVQWAPQLPARVMLAYDMQLRTQQEFAAESARMRAAIRKAGKTLTYYDDAAVMSDDIQSRDRLVGAVVDYVHGCLTAGLAPSVAAAH